jgi:hypothetical protein
MYTHDNDDVIPPNNFVYQVPMGSTNAPTLGEDKMTWCRGLAPLDTNLINASTSLLFIYNQNAAIYHCPADQSTINGYPNMLRKRSYNMSNRPIAPPTTIFANTLKSRFRLLCLSS